MGRVYNTQFLSHPPTMMCNEINFCCFICITQRWALQAVMKRQFFYIYRKLYLLVFQPQSIAEIVLLENRRPPY